MIRGLTFSLRSVRYLRTDRLDRLRRSYLRTDRLNPLRWRHLGNDRLDALRRRRLRRDRLDPLRRRHLRRRWLDALSSLQFSRPAARPQRGLFGQRRRNRGWWRLRTWRLFGQRRSARGRLRARRWLDSFGLVALNWVLHPSIIDGRGDVFGANAVAARGRIVNCTRALSVV